MKKEEILSQQKKRLLIIDDHSIFREGLVNLFEEEPDFELVGDAGSVQEGVQMALLFHPDIVLMDFSLPDGTGLDATLMILAELPDCKIVFLTVHEEDEKLFAAIRAGAKGYLSKNISGSNLVSSLRALYHGEFAISRTMASHLIEELSHYGQRNIVQGELLTKISRREADVLCELQDDVSNLEIATRLKISENTVKYHVRNILKKLGVQNRWEAGLIAKQFGLTRKMNTP